MNREQTFLRSNLCISFYFPAGVKKSDDSGCGFTESTIVAPASEIATLQAYITANYPGAVQDLEVIFL